MFWDVGKSRDEVSEIENFVRKKGDKHNNGARKKERKKERKTKECSKVQIVSTKINACLGIYDFRSSRARILSFVAVISTVKC